MVCEDVHERDSPGKRANKIRTTLQFYSRSSLTYALHIQDMFLYGIIVPVIPFALEQRSTIPHDKGMYLYIHPYHPLIPPPQSNTGSPSSSPYTALPSSLSPLYAAGSPIEASRDAPLFSLASWRSLVRRSC